ncbi:DUF4349 domain-containing protein [Dysgonomonas sp. 521]|uniref:DUF4349 domain-containing protein n=1 Tax=Dysgonomonas sp. 521 TaxID=2302932 RepID=UPI0013D4B724|nr:DUF4349 domain-containing protein [Dysgonomonas sp. 521]NDV94120.1 DUF4349 domain-containing protein [Dysgonomonas sp. 521]
MKHAKNIQLITMLILIGFISCGNNTKMATMDEAYALSSIPVEEEKSYASASDENSVLRFVPPQIVPSPMPNFIATKAASAQYDDGIHKFIRTAKMKFKVKDIPQAAQRIEDITISNKGFIINSTISNDPRTSTVNISKDSAYLICYNDLSASLELRVPHQILDSTLRQIAPLAVVIDYRTVEARDVTFDLMWDKMKQQRLAKKQQRMSQAIGTRSGKLNDAMDAEDALNNALEQADEALLTEYKTNDRIAYSTIYINLYQDRTEYKEKVARDTENIKHYEPGFGSKIIDALSDGWDVICAIFLALITIWPILILLTGAVIVFLRFRKHRGNAKIEEKH